MKLKVTINELCTELDGTLITTSDESHISAGYMCDLLSFVIGRAPENCAWITVIGNLNTIAVAVLADIPVVILAENSQLDDDAKTRAEQNGIGVIRTEKTAFECAVTLGKLLEQ